MKKFSFTLQTLLDINLSLEKQQKNELAAINHELMKLHEAKDMVVQKINLIAEQIKAELKAFCNVETYRNLNLYVISLNKKQEVIQEAINEKTLQKQMIQEALTQTMIKRKSLEKLKDKQFKEYLKEARKEQEKESDDFVTFNYLYG